MRSFGIYVDPIAGGPADGDDPGFLTNVGRELSFATYEEAERELRMIDDDMPGVRLSVREKTIAQFVRKAA